MGKPRAIDHFYNRLKLRKIDQIIDPKDLETIIQKSYLQGKFIEDKKHPGIEGPRLRMTIDLGGKLLIIILEKTRNCLLPITIWSKNI